jgi:hypothetical protein
MRSTSKAFLTDSARTDAHQALDALYVGILRKRVNWVVDVASSTTWFGCLHTTTKIVYSKTFITETEHIGPVMQPISSSDVSRYTFGLTAK